MDQVRIKVLLLGGDYVGKTSLVYHYINGRFNDRCETTIGVALSTKEIMLDDRLVTMELWDTAGHERFRSANARLYQIMDCCVLIYDVTRSESFEVLDGWRDDLLLHIISTRDPETFPFVLIGNKIDVEESKRQVSQERAMAWCQSKGNIPYFETSAKENINFEQALQTIVKNALARRGAEAPILPPLSSSVDVSPERTGGSELPRLGGLFNMSWGDLFLPRLRAYSRWPRESNEEPPQTLSVAQVDQNPVISSLATSSEIIAMLEERGCKNLSSSLNLQTCSVYPVSAGGFGDIFSCQLHDGTKVAIKAMRPYDADDLSLGKYQKRSAKELYTWSKCNHPNVAKLLGFAEFRDRLAMISDWAENGALPAYIKKYPSVDRCSLSTSICEGLAYLHASGIVHGDLKGANILVSSKGDPMLTDFGNASLVDSTVYFTATVCPASIRWAAPEILNDSGPPTQASDVYALGMTILETITGQVPFSDLRDIGIPMAVVYKKEIPKRPEGQIPTRSTRGNILWRLLMSCWVYEPELRPSASKVRDTMKTVTPKTLSYVT